MEHEMKNNNKKWQDAEATEMDQLLEYQTFLDKGKGGEAGVGYTKIRCHMVYDVKQSKTCCWWLSHQSQY
jgi:hypothetical protein